MPKVEILQRKIKLSDGTILPVPDANMTIDEAIDMYSAQYPELINSTVDKPETKPDGIIYPVTTKVGTKG